MATCQRESEFCSHQELFYELKPERSCVLIVGVSSHHERVWMQRSRRGSSPLQSSLQWTSVHILICKLEMSSFCELVGAPFYYLGKLNSFRCKRVR